MTLHNNLFYCHRLSTHPHFTKRPLTCVLRKDMWILSRRSKPTPFRKNVLNEISGKSNVNRKKSLAMGALQKLHRWTIPWSSAQQRFVWSQTDTSTIRTSTSQLIVTSAHYTVIAKASDCEEILVANLLKWPWCLSLCECVLFEKNQLQKSFFAPHFLRAKSLIIVSGTVPPRISCSMLTRHSVLS